MPAAGGREPVACEFLAGDAQSYAKSQGTLWELSGKSLGSLWEAAGKFLGGFSRRGKLQEVAGRSWILKVMPFSAKTPKSPSNV